MATKKDLKEFGCIGHRERMARSDEFAKACGKRLFPLHQAVERTMTTEYVRDEQSGRVSVVNKVTSRKVSDRDKGFKVNDFAMDSLVSIGAVDGLKFSTYSDGNIDRSLDNVDRLLDAIDVADAAARAAKSEISKDLDDLGY